MSGKSVRDTLAIVNIITHVVITPCGDNVVPGRLVVRSPTREGVIRTKIRAVFAPVESTTGAAGRDGDEDDEDPDCMYQFGPAQTEKITRAAHKLGIPWINLSSTSGPRGFTIHAEYPHAMPHKASKPSAAASS